MSKPGSRIRLSREGPLLATVDDLTNSKGERFEARYGVALCRCGASADKPFCDSSHIGIGFSDEPCAQSMPDERADEKVDAPPSIRITRNGPYEVCGVDLEIECPGVPPRTYALCRCGGSQSKPFCDGTHERIGFRDERN
jgi:CDGSH-type Zn-finger protein